MKCVRSVLCICIQNIRKWTYDYRVWIIAALLFFVCFDNSASLGELARFYGVRSTLWYFPFAYMSFHIKIIVTFPLVLLMQRPICRRKQSFYHNSRRPDKMDMRSAYLHNACERDLLSVYFRVFGRDSYAIR